LERGILEVNPNNRLRNCNSYRKKATVAGCKSPLRANTQRKMVIQKKTIFRRK